MKKAANYNKDRANMKMKPDRHEEHGHTMIGKTTTSSRVFDGSGWRRYATTQFHHR